MSAFGRLLARRADPISLEEFGALLARNAGLETRAGITMSPRRALGIAAWWSGVRYLAESVSSLPVRTYRDSAGNRSRRADPPWLRQPDVETTWLALVEHWMMSLLHRGNAYAFKLRNDLGQVTGLRALHPDRVKPGITESGTKIFAVRNGERTVPLTAREVLHIPGLSYNGVFGLDPISAQAETLGGTAAAAEFAARFWKQGNHLNGYISLPGKLSLDQAEELKAEWNRFHQGLTQAHEFGVLGNGAEYKVVGLNPEQTQLLQSRKYGVIEVAQILRVPPHKLYDLERAIYSNIEHQNIDAVVDSLRPWLVRIEAWINVDPHLLPPRNFIEFAVEGLLRGDTKTRYESYDQGIKGGWMMPSEARALENLQPVAGLDYFQRPLNVARVLPDGSEIVDPKEDVA